MYLRMSFCFEKLRFRFRISRFYFRRAFGSGISSFTFGTRFSFRIQRSRSRIGGSCFRMRFEFSDLGERCVTVTCAYTANRTNVGKDFFNKTNKQTESKDTRLVVALGFVHSTWTELNWIELELSWVQFSSCAVNKLYAFHYWRGQHKMRTKKNISVSMKCFSWSINKEMPSNAFAMSVWLPLSITQV